MFLLGNDELDLKDGEISMKANKETVTEKNMSRRANNLSGKEWLLNSFSIWRGLGKNGEERGLKHPAMFTIKLVSQLLESYTCCQGEKLLDPFAGAGTSLIAALTKDMDAVGFDVNKEFREVFKSRTSKLFDAKHWAYHLHDARNMGDVIPPETIDICITSPPYWDILNQKRSADGKQARPYSAMKSDLGNMESYDEFLLALGDVMGEVYKALKDGKIFILNVMDLRKKANFYPLHMDVVTEARKQGFSLEDIIIWDRQDEYNNLRPLGYPYKFIINKVHEYLLVFKK